MINLPQDCFYGSMDCVEGRSVVGILCCMGVGCSAEDGRRQGQEASLYQEDLAEGEEAKEEYSQDHCPQNVGLGRQ